MILRNYRSGEVTLTISQTKITKKCFQLWTSRKVGSGKTKTTTVIKTPPVTRLPCFLFFIFVSYGGDKSDVNDEFRITWKEMVVTYFHVLLQRFTWGTEENDDTYVQADRLTNTKEWRGGGGVVNTRP
jgi:hypothetical protein